MNSSSCHLFGIKLVFQLDTCSVLFWSLSVTLQRVLTSTTVGTLTTRTCPGATRLLTAAIGTTVMSVI